MSAARRREIRMRRAAETFLIRYYGLGELERLALLPDEEIDDDEELDG